MANPFGGFVHTSPLSSLFHDPCVSLSSNCIRDFFGPTVQTVADCLQSRGGSSTLTQIITSIRGQCGRVWNEERERLVGLLIKKNNDNNNINQHHQYRVHRARGPEHAGFVVDAESIRAALLVLIQHSLVTVQTSEKEDSKSSKGVVATYHYSFHVHRARLLPRYPRYVEYTRKAVDETGAALVQELLVNGRMRTRDAIVSTVNTSMQKEGSTTALGINSDKTNDHQTQAIKSASESFVRLVNAGYIERVLPLNGNARKHQETEFHYESSSPPPKKKRKTSKASVQKQVDESGDTEEKVLPMLQGATFNHHLPLDAVWRANLDMFHDSLRAFCLGRLVAERYGHKVQSGGSMVTAALRYEAFCKHGKRLKVEEQVDQNGDLGGGIFTPQDIIPYLPIPIQNSLKTKGKGDGSSSPVANLSKALVELARFTWPRVLLEVEGAEGHPQGGKFQIATIPLVEHLKERALHQATLDRHGEVAARICSYLQATGHQEADAIAEAAMVPAKDVREVLHRLYRANYVNLMSLQQSKQHNPANAIYLWSVERSRMFKTVTNNVSTALFRMRLRRQHEMEVGKDWIERAKEARTGTTDENDHELDKANYNKFCKGLERLDNAALQLDETLMVLQDF